MTTIAIVGIGRWGKNLVHCFTDLTEVKYCCHSGSSDNAEWVATRFPKMELTEHYDRVLQDDEIDAVVIATPVETHGDLTRRALRADKDVFVEKPLANSASEAAELVELADSQNGYLFTGYVFLYAPAMKTLCELTRSDPPVFIRATWEKFGTFNAPIEYSLLCHDIAIGKFLFDEPFQNASVVDQIGIITDRDLYGVTYETATGHTLSTRYDRTARANEKSLVVVTESGRRYEFSDDRLYELREKSHVDRTPETSAEPLSEECRTFLEWIEGGEKPPSAGSFGAEVNKALELL